MSERIGFIGLGNMGRPMSSNLARKGFPLTVFDTRPGQVELLAALGARPAKSIGEVIDASDIVITIVPDTPDVEAIVMGPDGTHARGRPGMLHLDMSTIAPAASRRMGEALNQKGIRMVDAGVGRSPAHAERGESLFMVGASAEDLERVRPVLMGMGDKVIHAGPPGSGIALKVTNNYLAMCLCQINAEAFTMAAKLGISAKTMFEVVTSTLASNDHLKNYWPTKALKGDIEPGFALDLAFKDISLGVNAAADVGAPSHVGTAVRAAMDRARKEHGLGQKDVTALLNAAAAEAGIKPPVF